MGGVSEASGGGALTMRSGSESVVVGVELSSCLRTLSFTALSSSPGSSSGATVDEAVDSTVEMATSRRGVPLTLE